MQLFLHIKVKKEPFLDAYGPSPQLKNWIPGVSLFDVDNHSDAVSIQTAVNAMQQAERIFIQMDAEPDVELGGSLKLLNQVIRLSVPIAIYYTGDHDKLNKIMIRFSDKLIANHVALKDAVKQFFTK